MKMTPWATKKQKDKIKDLKKVSKKPCDPVYKDETGLYYFYDETWCDLAGPFETEEECKNHLQRYADSL